MLRLSALGRMDCSFTNIIGYGFVKSSHVEGVASVTNTTPSDGVRHAIPTKLDMLMEMVRAIVPS